MKLPKQLRNPAFRFFLIGRNKKTPIQKKWNSEKCYMFFDSKLTAHVNQGSNIGLATGYGNIIVIDFDDKSYQLEKEHLLPKTFTVKTAGKGLKHKYYLLKDEMITKKGIDRWFHDGVMITDKEAETALKGITEEKRVEWEREGMLRKIRVADIQAAKCAVVCPPSHINRKPYSVIDNSEIAEITMTQLKAVFNITSFRKNTFKRVNSSPQPLKVQAAIDLLTHLEIQRTNDRHFKCYRHPMHGSGNLHIFPNGSFFCFHCLKSWKDTDHFYIDYVKFFGIKGKNG